MNICILNRDALGQVFDALLDTTWKFRLKNWHRVMLVCKLWYEVQKYRLHIHAYSEPKLLDDLYTRMNFDKNHDNNIVNNQMFIQRQYSFHLFFSHQFIKIVRGFIPFKIIKLISQNFTNLRTLKLHTRFLGVRKSIEIFRRISRISTLEHLNVVQPYSLMRDTHIRYYPPTSEILLEISKLKNLKSLSSNFYLSKSDQLLQLIKLENLKKLHLEIIPCKSMSLFPELMTVIKRLLKLKSLTLVLPDNFPAFPNQFFHELKNYRNVKKIKLSINLIQDLEIIKKLFSKFHIREPKQIHYRNSHVIYYLYTHKTIKIKNQLTPSNHV